MVLTQDLQAWRVFHDPAVLDGDLGPGLPWGIERGEMEAGGAAVARCRRAPLAGFEQTRLVVLVVDAAAGLADQPGVGTAALGPADARPGDRRHVAAGKARHMENYR